MFPLIVGFFQDGIFVVVQRSAAVRDLDHGAVLRRRLHLEAHVDAYTVAQPVGVGIRGIRQLAL